MKKFWKFFEIKESSKSYGVDVVLNEKIPVSTRELRIFNIPVIEWNRIIDSSEMPLVKKPEAPKGWTKRSE